MNNTREKFKSLPKGSWHAFDFPTQFAAVICAVRLGENLQKQFPEVAIDYKSGLSYSKIVKKYKIDEANMLSFRTAINAVYFAVRGYRGNIKSIEGKVNAYPGLLSYVDYPKGGSRLYSQQELDFIKSKSSDPQYLIGRRINWLKLIFDVNTIFHEGLQVRTRVALWQKINKMKPKQVSES